jgi:outer membrane protein OmpA-like peptidoglycan-associated protein
MKQVKGNRLTTKGYGEQQPLKSNSTSSGREENRRVEVAIYANTQMKKIAEKGNL